MYINQCKTTIDAPPDTVFAVVSRLGGEHGWFSVKWLWRVRDLLDRALGGRGFDIARPHPRELHPGDVVDLWKVKRVDRPANLTFHSEMKSLGEGTLEFSIQSGAHDAGTSELTQTASLVPHGLLGQIYWYAAAPVHHYFFRRLVKGIARTAEAEVSTPLHCETTLER